MAFQRSYSKVWWGSDNQLPSLTSGTNVGSSFTSGGYYYSSLPSSSSSSSSSSYHAQAGARQQQEHQPFSGSGYHSLDYNSLRMFSGNLSRIQEVEDEQQNMSKLSWEKHDSPGSLRSQDSGFSDNDESHSTRSLGGRSFKAVSPSTKSDKSHRSTDSPASTHTIATPPTVIRRVGRSEFYSPLVSVSRRISFSGSPTTTESGERENLEVTTAGDDVGDVEGSTLLTQLDSIQLLNSTPKYANDIDGDVNDSVEATGSEKVKVKSKIKRRRRIVRTPTKPLTAPTKRRTLPKEVDNNQDDATDWQSNVDSDKDENTFGVGPDNGDDGESSFDELEQEISELRQSKGKVPEYNNETVYFGVRVEPQPYNNETVILGGFPEDTNNNTLKAENTSISELHSQQRTSTPKVGRQLSGSSTRGHTPNDIGAPSMDFLIFEPITSHYINPLLDGHTPALQHWLHELRSNCEQEVMSTLQTKSIAQEAFKNLTITTNTVAKLIRQLQQRALYMQSDFERMERILSGNETNSLHDALSSAEQLVCNIIEFTRVLERRSVFFSESRIERKRYEDNLDQIRLITKDTRYSLERHHYINFESLLDDIQVLKRYILIAMRQVFERMVRIIVHSIEQSRCDLMLRANINMVATLTNIDYGGFASLTDAFVQNEAVRALLIVCLEHKLSSARALALRALATICCAPAAIAQLSSCDGIEILRDILQIPTQGIKRSPAERREAVSLLTQITAAWHGPEHRVLGLKDCVESIVAGLTQLVGESTSCSQTLLLCAAALNNLSRMEVTSHYSIMSNETVFKLIETVEAKQQSDKEEGISIFLYEQIVSMLHNMSLNKKCHSHLANGCIINFITSVYEMEFYKSYESRAESDAQRRTVKSILHTLIRLVHDSNGGGLGLELLQQQRLPALLFKLANSSHGNGLDDYTQTTFEGCHQLGRDIELLVRQLELAQKEAQKQQHCLYGCNGNIEVQDDDILRGEENSGSGGNGLKFNLTKHESFV